MSAKKPKIGLVGFGYWGPNLLRNLVSSGRADVIGVIDIHPGAQNKVKSLYPHIPVESHFGHWLEKSGPDAVVIATPPATHCETAIQCLEAGAHVLIEKPMAMSVLECDQIMAASKKARKKVMVDHTFAYHPAVQYIAEGIKKGDFGKLFFYDSVRVNLGGFQALVNALWDLGPHDFSILDLFREGEMPETISAVGIKHFDAHVENISYVHLKYPDRFIGHLHLNWIAPVKIRTLMLGGSKQMALYDENLMTEKVKIYDKGVNLQAATPQDFRVSYRVGEMRAPAISGREALASMMEAFLDMVEKGTQPVSDGASGHRVVQLLEAATLSMQLDGAPIEPGKVRAVPVRPTPLRAA